VPVVPFLVPRAPAKILIFKPSFTSTLPPNSRMIWPPAVQRREVLVRMTGLIRGTAVLGLLGHWGLVSPSLRISAVGWGRSARVRTGEWSRKGRV
jgi:hypothetical protein